MNHRTLVRTGAGVFAVAALITLVGCGSSTRPSAGGADHASTAATSSVAPFDPAFAARVNAVCADEVAAHAAHPFPLKGFDPANPTPDQIRQAAAFFAAYGDTQGFDDKLHALGQPTNDVSAWGQLVGLIDQDTARALAQQKAGAAGDVAAWKKTLDPAKTLYTQITRDGIALGFTATTPCGRYYDE